MPFFIVYSPQGPTPPVKQHKTHKEAMGAAHRMASYHPGREFFVMKSASKPVLKPTGGVDVDRSAGRATPSDPDGPGTADPAHHTGEIAA